MRNFIVTILLFATLAYGQEKSLKGKISWISFTSYKLQSAGAGQEEWAPGLLVRFIEQGGRNSFLVLTDKLGTAFFPIEAGTYCMEAYGVNGQPAKLSERSQQSIHRCFTAIADKPMELSLTLSADAKYGGSIPTLGVE